MKERYRPILFISFNTTLDTISIRGNCICKRGKKQSKINKGHINMYFVILALT